KHYRRIRRAIQADYSRVFNRIWAVKQIIVREVELMGYLHSRQSKSTYKRYAHIIGTWLNTGAYTFERGSIEHQEYTSELDLDLSPAVRNLADRFYENTRVRNRNSNSSIMHQIERSFVIHRCWPLRRGIIFGLLRSANN
ncbi:PIPO, partial [Sugarcane streak mosaic virus]|uniref:PIPO n=1 Tax=Sugarcane streak mosaic virus TaxID=53954 RepID=UPI0002654FF3